MIDTIKLNFINKSDDMNNSSIVITQQNPAEDTNTEWIAWTVIKNCGKGDNHPFEYPLQNEVAAQDSWGNVTPRLRAENGQAFEMVRNSSGDVLRLTKDRATSADEIEIRNELPQGAISGNVYKGGKLLAQKTNIAPGEKAVFEFKPAIYVSVASQVQQGQSASSAVISLTATKIDLLGVQSADLVLTGGGAGPASEPFEFQLENVT